MAGAARARGRGRGSRAGSHAPNIPVEATFSDARDERAPPLLPVGEDPLASLRERLSPTIAGPSQTRSPHVANEGDEGEEDEEEDQGPPSRTPTSSVRTSLRSAPAPLPPASSALLAEVQRKRQEVADLRLARELDALNDEIEGREPEQPVEITGTMLPVRKRQASVQLSGHPTKMPKIHNAKTYSGESLEELSQYAAWWKIQWQHPDYNSYDDAIRIATAALSLTGYALEKWSQRTTPLDTWDEYLEYQRGLIRAPANRMSDALRGVWRFRQKEGQSVQRVLAELVKLRAEITPLTDEQRRAWELLLALRLELRLAVQGELPTIETEEQVLTSAQRQEELLAVPNKGKGKETYADATGKQPPSKPKAGAPPARKPASATLHKTGPGASKKERTTPGNYACFVCGEEGHIAKDCPKRAASKGSASVSTSKQEKSKPQKK